jgi:hypothetical protein
MLSSLAADWNNPDDIHSSELQLHAPFAAVFPSRTLYILWYVRWKLMVRSELAMPVVQDLPKVQ